MPAETVTGTAGWPTLGELEEVVEAMDVSTLALCALSEERYEPLFERYGKEPSRLPSLETLAQTTAFVALIEQRLSSCRESLDWIAKARDEGALGLRRHGWQEADDAS